ncbi:MAG: hypothetical protein AAGK32_21165, partial [Actinomycetota bacterium]
MAGARRELRFAAELLGLTGLVIAQPILAVYGAAPEEFTARRASTAAIVVFTAVVVLAPPLALWVLEQPARLLGPERRERVHRFILSALAGLLALEVLKELIGTRAVVLLVVAVSAAVAFFLAASRFPPVRQAVRYLAV